MRSEENWKAYGVCNPDASGNILDPDFWWPAATVSDENIAAATECLDCPVLGQCRDYRDEVDPPHGVWAGQIRIQGGRVAAKNRTCPSCGQPVSTGYQVDGDQCSRCAA